MGNTTAAKNEILQIRYSESKIKELRQLQNTALLEATSHIKDNDDRNLEMMRLSRLSKYTLSGIARQYLNKATEVWLPHEVMN